MNDAVITLNGLTKNFAGMDKPAVAPLDCTVHAGYVTGLVGPDGAGKTTLMRMLAGLLKPDAGSATVIGFDPIKDDSALHAVVTCPWGAWCSASALPRHWSRVAACLPTA